MTIQALFSGGSRAAGARALAALVGASVAGGLLAAGCAPSKQYGVTAAAPAASYYPLAVGDRWTYQYVPGKKRYQSTVMETRRFGSQSTFAMTIGQNYSYLAVLPSGVYQFAQGEPEQPTDAVVFQPPQRIYKLPFVVGDHWSTPVLVDLSDKQSVTVQVYGRVEAIESVTVPAGTFKDCVRILYDDPRDTPANVANIWFAPGVGIVQTETAIERDNLPPKTYKTELVSYHVKSG